VVSAGEAASASLEDAEVATEPVRPFPPTAPAAYWWWLLILYMFYVMAVVCDDYLVPTVDIMCERWAITEDVAGATLMAFACNGPELLTNTCAIFLTHSKVGMGTIVGSAIFNVLVITGACPLVTATGVLDIPMGTFLRDALFSAVSIALLAWALPVIDLFRASVLFGFAFVYVYVVAKFRTWFGEPDGVHLKELEQKILSREEKVAELRDKFAGRKFERSQSEDWRGAPPLPNKRRSQSFDTEQGHYQRLGGFARQVSVEQAYTTGPQDRREFWDAERLPPGGSEARSKLKETRSIMSGFRACVHYLLVYPTALALYWTIPDVKVESKKSRYIVAFFLSMAWLSGTAWIVCLGSDWINLYWGIPQSFLGLTLAAVGTSFPNLFASMITARAGRGPIAVSNALGSNVQNVFLVLALPIWIRVLQKGEYVMTGNDINVSIVWMAVTLGVVVVSVAAQKFQLTTEAGWFFMIVYFAFVVQMTLYTSA